MPHKMITLTRQDGKEFEIKTSWIVNIDPDGFGNGCWVYKGDGSKVHVKETLAEVRKKMQGVGA